MPSSGIIILLKMRICRDPQASLQLFANPSILCDSTTIPITYCMRVISVVLSLMICIRRLIIADGQVTPNELQETKDAIVEASRFPLSIVMVGVGVSEWLGKERGSGASRESAR